MGLVRRASVLVIIVALLIAAFSAGWLVARLGLGAAVDPASLSEAERQFTERMRDVSLIGTFTIDGQDDRTPHQDRYDISSVEKVGDNLWRFTVDMHCCGVNGAIPVAVPMRWIGGDTPMIMMTDTSLPGVGTFTVRLLFYGDRYAGTWQHRTVGGHMWGRIAKRARIP
jgi:hypothetical protein